jgi:hypothetical protein
MRKYELWTPKSETRYIQNTIEAAQAEHRTLLWEFAGWLDDERGNAPGTIVGLVRSVRTLLSIVAADAEPRCALAGLSVSRIEEFFVEFCEPRLFAMGEEPSTSDTSLARPTAC